MHRDPEPNVRGGDRLGGQPVVLVADHDGGLAREVEVVQRDRSAGDGGVEREPIRAQAGDCRRQRLMSDDVEPLFAPWSPCSSSETARRSRRPRRAGCRTPRRCAAPPRRCADRADSRSPPQAAERLRAASSMRCRRSSKSSGPSSARRAPGRSRPGRRWASADLAGTHGTTTPARRAMPSAGVKNAAKIAALGRVSLECAFRDGRRHRRRASCKERLSQSRETGTCGGHDS